MSWQDWIRYAAGGCVIVALCWAMAHIAVRLETTEERRARRNANRTKLRVADRFDVPPRVIAFNKRCVRGLHYTSREHFREGSNTCTFCERMLSQPSESVGA